MSHDPYELISTHQHKGALIDTNLMLVYLIGQSGRHLLSRCGSTAQYEQEFEDIKVLVGHFSKLYTTPNVLTELSNLGYRDLGATFFEILRLFINLSEEQFCSSRDAVQDSSFSFLGLTDSSIAKLGKSTLVITTDVKLYLRLMNAGSPVINYNHLRKFS